MVHYGIKNNLCIYMYTLTHKYIHTQRHIQIYTYIHGHTHMHMYIIMHMHMYIPCINEQKKTMYKYKYQCCMY